jgi:TolB-like protein
LDADPRLDVVTVGKSGSPQPSVRYLIQGVVYSEDGGRHFLSLKVVDAQSGKTVWSDNYDYRGISPDMIAPDVIEVLLK